MMFIGKQYTSLLLRVYFNFLGQENILSTDGHLGWL